MTDQDRKDHELAAKAAGYVLTFKEGSCKGGAYCGAFIERGGEVAAWRPKEDDGDSLRLAVKVKIGLRFVWNGCDDQYDAVWAETGRTRCDEELGMTPSGDQFDEDAATRLTVFRCAVEIGRAKQ